MPTLLFCLRIILGFTTFGRDWEIVVSIGSVLMVLTISIFGGYAMGRMNFRGKKGIGFLTLLTYLLPSTFLAIPYYKTKLLWTV